MRRLTLEEAKSLASVFGELDDVESGILLVFNKARNKHVAYLESQKFPKKLRVPMASLYRKVDKLCSLYFLEVVKQEKFVRGNLRATVNYYQRTLKGLLAAYIYGYARLLRTKPADDIEELEIKSAIEAIEASQIGDLFTAFLRWHKNRGNDLSRIKFEMKDLVLDCIRYFLDNPEQLSEAYIAQGIKKLEELGVNVPKVPPAEIRRNLIFMSKALDEITNTLYASVRKKWEAKEDTVE